MTSSSSFSSLRVARFNSPLLQSYDLQEVQPTQKDPLLEWKYFTGIKISKTFGGPEAFTSNTIIKKCGRKTSSGGQENYILKAH